MNPMFCQPCLRLLGLSLSSATLLMLTACSSSPPPEVTPPPEVSTETTTTPATEATTTSNAPTTASTAMKFKRGDGSEAFSLKLKADGAKLVDASDQELARLTVDAAQKVKIKDASDRVLGYVVPEMGYWKVKNADQTEELFILRRQADGDYKLEDGKNQLIYRIKQREYGYEVESPTDESLYKVKTKANKIDLRDASDITVFETKAAIAPIAVACFGLEALSLEQQAALAFAVNNTGGQ